MNNVSNLPARKAAWLAIVGPAYPGIGSAKVKPLTPSIRQVQLAACRVFGVELSDLVSRRRGANLLKARHAAMAVASELTGKSFTQIGRQFNRTDAGEISNLCHRVRAEAIMGSETAIASIGNIKAELAVEMIQLEEQKTKGLH